MEINYPKGGVVITSDYIRGRGQPTVYDESFPEYLINNPPPANVIVRDYQSRFVLNGKLTPKLLLTMNKKYQFNIMTNIPFYFSTTPGGLPDIWGIPAVTRDLRTYTPVNTTPKKFYYTSPDGRAYGEVNILTS